MSQRRYDSEVVYLKAWAGFGPGQTYGWILPEPEFILKRKSPYYRADGPLPVALADNTPCCLDCGDDYCREWCNVQLLEGETRQEAVASLLAGRFRGWAYHVSECEMSADRPPEPALQPSPGNP